MYNIKDINVENYRYTLPDEKIARYPAEQRDMSKLLVYKDGTIRDDIFMNLPEYLDNSSALVFNNTKVIYSRLMFRKVTGAVIEIFCLEPVKPSEYSSSLGSTGPVQWKCIAGNLKKWKSGNLEMGLTIGKQEITVRASLISRDEKEITVSFSWSGNDITFSEILEAGGRVPVPPYLKRDDEPIDRNRYQTVYSLNKGSVAAPTAGLHFTESLLKKLQEKNIEKSDITLHVGAGTFIPVKSRTIGGHVMHRERFIVKRDTIELLLQRKIIAVGTTSVRTIESLYHLGCKLLRGYEPGDTQLELGQWDAYAASNDNKISDTEAFSALLDYLDNNKLGEINASTSLIIVPGYNFHVIKGLITNYHMPASTLLLLVSALVGNSWKDIYNHALNGDYRFLSYGDSSLLLPS